MARFIIQILFLFSAIISSAAAGELTPFASISLIHSDPEITNCTPAATCPAEIDRHEVPVGLSVGAYYETDVIDIGVDAMLQQDASINILVRKRLGPVAFVVGAGAGEQHITSELLPPYYSNDQSTESAKFYKAEIHFLTGEAGWLFIGAQESEATHTVDGEAISDPGPPPTFSDVSADIDVRLRKYYVGYAVIFGQ